MENREINLATGVGDLNFAMAEQDVIKILGHPNVIDNDTLNNCQVYYYDELALAVVFVEIENRLVIDSFEMEDEPYQLWNTQVFNQAFNRIVDLLKQNNISEFEVIKDDYSTHILYQNLYIGFDLDKVSDICLSNPNL